MIAAHAGISVDDFEQQADAFLRSAQHPTLGRGYLACAYAPMVELLRYLDANGFSNYIASGGGRDFMRPISDEMYGIPRDRVIGSATALDYVADDGGGSIMRKPEADVLDDGPEKPVRIWSRTGRRPLLAAGNSNGDIPMLDFAQHADKPTLRLLVLHDDAEREFDYTAGAEAVARARAGGGLDGGQHQERLVDRLRVTPSAEDMVWIEGATYRMGSDSHYPEEAPAHRVSVDGFWIDAFQVTNRLFAAFVDETGYVTVAERPLDPSAFPGAPAENLVPGSLVFTRTTGPVDLRHLSQWWTWTPGACWRHPDGPGELDRGPRGRARGARRLRGRRGVRGLGREGAADRGGVGAGRARRARRLRLRLGRRAGGSRRAPCELLARRLPLAVASPATAPGAGRLLPAERLRPLRHGRQRLGVDGRLVRRAPSGGRRQAVLRAGRTRAARQSRRATTRRSRSSGSRAR